MIKASDESVKIARHINKFINEYVPSQKTNSEHTVKSYHIAISLYIDFLETSKNICPEKFNADCFSVSYIEDWLLWLMEKRDSSSSTCNNRLASLRVFLAYLGKTDICYLHLSQAASQIGRKKEQRKKVNGMSKNAVQALLSVPNLSSKTDRRDLVLMTVIYSTAARLDEILALKIKQLHLDAVKPYVTVIGKGDKIRSLYLLPKTVSLLKKYIEEFHGNSPDDEAFVFYSRNGGQFGKMTQPAVKKRLLLHAESAHKICSDVPPNLHAHQLRHAKASHWLEDGMNIVQISFLLGHEHLKTTMVYLDITTEEEAKALATLESETDKSIPKKWKQTGASLASFCGVRAVKS
jgi:site-specific recombinase XerD